MPKSTHFDEDEQIEEKPFNFHEYLQEKGVIPNLKKAFEKLYEEENKPSDSVTFIRKILCETCPDQDDYLKAVNNLKEALDRIAELEKELALLKGSLKRTQSEYYMLLSVYFEALQDNKECKSLLKKHLTQQLIDSLQDLRTANKGNILDCLESGLENQDYVIGFYACDAEAYTLFAPLFDPIIEEYHGIKQETVQPTLDWGDICSLPDLDPENKYIQKIIISCERSVEGFPFNPLMNIEQYQEIREKLHSFCDCLSGEYKGTFYEVENLDKDMKRQLIGEKLLYSDDDKILKDANGLRYFPEGRGLFINGSKNFIIWCNHEDHLKITSIEKGANFRSAYDRFITGVDKISRKFKFIRHERYGFLTFSPINLGTTLQVSIHIKLPKLSFKKEKMREITERHNFGYRGTHGENFEVKDGVFDISNIRRIGMSEFELIQEITKGIQELIETEQTFESKKK